jgi:alpha-beta hydrolase superfamily lysophospholipase
MPLLGLLSACLPAVQQAQPLPTAFSGPRFEADRFISFDGTALGLSSWAPAEGEPWAVVIGLHGMNDYGQTFAMAGPWWAERGIATYAYDQRGFGRSPQRGVWGGEKLLTADLAAAIDAARRKHPNANIAVVGESMGAATALAAFGSQAPPRADRLVILAPAVWGWSNLPLAYRATLWLGAHTAPRRPVTAPRRVVRRIQPSDNVAMLQALGRDKNMIFETRIDALYGLVRLMERAFQRIERAPPQTLMLTGAKDQIIPRRSLERAAERLPAGVRRIDYPNGYHMLLRDLQAEVVWGDILTFLKDPAAV